MTGPDVARERPPAGVVLAAVALALYGLFWVLTATLAGAVGDALIVVVSTAVAAGVLGLAYFLYAGDRAAWWLAVALLAGSTLWRLTLVARGSADDLVNALVGVLLLVLLVRRREFFRPAGA